MYLSMWILADWLKRYQTEATILDGSRIIRNVRLLSEADQIKSSYVYVGRTQDFIASATEGIICVNNGDYLILNAEDIEEIFNEIMNAFDFYNDWAAGLREKIAEGCSLQTLIDYSHIIFDEPMLILNSSHMVQAISPDYAFHQDPPESFRYLAEHKFMPLEQILEFNQLLEGTMESRDPYLFTNPRNTLLTLQQNLFYNEEHIGWAIILLINHPYTKAMGQLCEEFVQLIGYWVRLHEDAKVLSPQSELFLQLLTGETSGSQSVWDQLHCCEWQEADEKYLLKIETRDRDRYLHSALIHQIDQTFSGCYVLSFESAVVLVTNNRLYPLDRLKEKLTPLLHQCHGISGISYPFLDVMKLPQFYRQATIALQYGRERGTAFNRCEEFALLYAQNIIRENSTTDLAHPVLEKIREYDKSHDTEYLATLKEFLIHERSQTITAQVLHIHKNTLIYRVARIQELFALDLDSIPVRLHLLFSFLLLGVEKE